MHLNRIREPGKEHVQLCGTTKDSGHKRHLSEKYFMNSIGEPLALTGDLKTRAEQDADNRSKMCWVMWVFGQNAISVRRCHSPALATPGLCMLN